MVTRSFPILFLWVLFGDGKLVVFGILFSVDWIPLRSLITPSHFFHYSRNFIQDPFLPMTHFWSVGDEEFT